jgi:Family of unknown function (DUF5898)
MIESLEHWREYNEIKSHDQTTVRVVKYPSSSSVNQGAYFTKVKKSDLPDMKMTSLPGDSMLEFCLFQPLGSGSHGSVCKAMSVDGSVCAVKMFYSVVDRRHLTFNQLRSKADHEAACWNVVYKGYFPPGFCRVLELPELEEVHMLMPFVDSIKSEDHGVLLNGTELEGALKLFSSRNYRHNDVHWRHVGRALTHRGLAIVLVDLGDVDKLEHGWGPTEQEEWVRETLLRLGKNMDAPSSPTQR